LLDVFSAFQEIYTDSRLILIGIGALEESVKEQADTLGLSEKVFFLGERGDVNQILQAMDCFVMPSLFEGLPFVLVEAQSAGLPCVVSNTVDRNVKLTDILSFLSLEESSEVWAKEVSRAMTGERKDTSKQIIDAGFSIEQTVSKLVLVYDGIGKEVGSR
jgi:glycosyltransferase involved in cell wall biosynthesis